MVTIKFIIFCFYFAKLIFKISCRSVDAEVSDTPMNNFTITPWLGTLIAKRICNNIWQVSHSPSRKISIKANSIETYSVSNQKYHHNMPYYISDR